MTNYSQITAPQREAYLGHINQRWGQLYSLEKEYGDRAFKYLLLVNGGGAIATLGFLGASQVARESCGAKTTLILFVIGIIFVGLSTAKQYYYLSGLFKSWKKDVGQFFTDQLSWELLLKQDEDRVADSKLDHFLPWFSFACFVVGSTVGGISIF